MLAKARLNNPMRPIECVALMLVRANQVLAEKRKRTKKVMPGAVALQIAGEDAFDDG